MPTTRLRERALMQPSHEVSDGVPPANIGGDQRNISHTNLSRPPARTGYQTGYSAVQGRISILIPSYLRPDDLRTTLSKTIQQTYLDKEIIVVDDGTPGDAIAQAVSDFEEVTYLRTPQNVGLIAARNFGASHCSGEFVLNLDDDSWLVDQCDLERIVQFMSEHPRCGVAALNIATTEKGYLWPFASDPQSLRTYKGCGNVYRSDILAKVGEYIPEFYRQGEEVERSLRILDAGYDILSAPNIRVFHAESTVNRNWPRHVAFEAANYLRRELIRAPLWLLPLGCFRALRWALRHRDEMDRELYRAEILGSRVPLLQFVRRHRAPVRTLTYFQVLRRT